MYDYKMIDGSKGIVDIIDKTLYTHVGRRTKDLNHANRVSELCKLMGKAMGLPEVELNQLEMSGLFHDIGKIAIREQILEKTEPLTAAEWNEIMRHPEIGYRILCTSFEMTEIAKFVLHHHERYDGMGYPRGLKADEIPLISRVITVADSYDAMTNLRSYRETFSQEQAVEELLTNRGTQFDPDLVEIFVNRVLRSPI